MPWFRSKVLTACAWAAPVLAAVLPTHSHSRAARAEDLLHLDVQHNYAQATFSVPCIGCLGPAHTDQNDESLILSFTSHAQDDACGSSNVTLNGVHLPQEWSGDFASGSGSYQALTHLTQNERFLQRDLDLEWQTACLHGHRETEAAQVLTVNIKAIDGKPLDAPSGFTISFKQHTSPPLLLRLESAPDPSANNTDVAESWREPPQALRLVASGNVEGSPRATEAHSLEEDIRQLKALESELEVLQSLITKQKKLIHSRLRKEAQNVSQELSNCDGISCIFKTVADKAIGAWRVAYLRYKPGQKPIKMGHPEHIFPQTHDHVAQVAQVSDDSLRVSTPAPQAYKAEAVELPPRPTKESSFVLAIEITFGILCCGCLFTAIRHKCSSLRTRTERAAAREERINARAYRRAARQHAWSKWWRGNWARRDSERIADYEEKRALISEQENVLEDAMQEEIRQLRAAHDVVNDLVRDAEEGRSANHPPFTYHREQTHAPSSPLSTASTYPPTSLPEIPSRPLSRTESLPSYRSDTPTEPPGYDSDRDMSDVVANGFHQYAAASTTSEVSSHWTPESSVVDVSPRPSAETLRYPVSIYTLDEEESDGD
ncbi:hypothetical protein COCMIDRAFT_8212 [Bipolaris oryzae ATCC 44560]|uniref:Uncharacterized protein n=1 Tax=Bipolaris oryzae ATCC 44560 TaxID=930090 RepID=W6Z3A6_COCMI|nr:uncharacterized protein COCMIDRAFT_8212 [Bipolaris oryzae ATCC 44560]EUC42144.1 hypothetical protein COCMIDRAFT_8212 [Bipolaris oryzae ATCC 44560]